MKQVGILALVAVVVTAAASVASAHGRHADRWAYRHAQGMSWHAPYYNTTTGAPIALVVPPTAHMQTKWGWGVSQGTMTPIYHQFGRRYAGESGSTMNSLQGTPRWPSHTDQFGVYYIRGPW